MPADEDASGRSVMVVSSDERIVEEARLGFGDDLEIVPARDGRDALPLLATFVPACIVIDIHTGSAGGVGLARDLRELLHLRDVPILMLLERDQDKWLAAQAGADATRTKPLGSAEFADSVRQLIAAADPAA